ncbi:MAG: hypothetical protein IJM59_05405 [Proteobacteria bacterium]|nr:hypothetical protein [Pseudomonadota bacterium]
MSDEMESIYEMINKLGGIEKFQSNPFAFIGEVFKHPELLAEIDKMAKTPEMQKQIAESMNNPMFQQIVGNNPLLSGMMNDYKNRQAAGSADDVVDAGDEEYDDEDDEDDDDEFEEDFADSNVMINGYDFNIPGWRPIDWLNPVSNQPFYIPDDAEKRVHFSDILDEIPEECRERVEIIAEKRLQQHFNPISMGQLDAMADKYELTPMDLMATSGFIGEVCYCSTLLMTEPEEDLCDLAKFALASLQRRSGYPVSSYLLQNLLYLDSFDDIEESDWMNFIWSLSGNPMEGRDGNFAATWSDASLIAEIAADNLAEEPEMFLGVCLGLAGWQALDTRDVDDVLGTMFAEFENKDALCPLVLNCLCGQKLYSMQLTNMSDKIKAEAVSFLIANGKLDTMLEKAALWPVSCEKTAMILVEKLDALWDSADADRRDAFMQHAISMDSEDLALAAFKLGYSKQSDKYRLMALGSSFDAVKRWVEHL